MSKTKSEVRAEAVAVSDDMMHERDLWLKEGTYVAIVCADPIYYGRLKAMTPTHYFLEDACWVPDTGRAHTFAADPSTATEVEYIGQIAVERPVTAIYAVAKQVSLKTK